jgi:trk system potassium uptake protein
VREAFVGASTLTVSTARNLLERGHEVVIVERDPVVIRELSAEFDCGFIEGDGSKPAILREVDPRHTDTLFCLTGSDQANIIASLVARSLGFRRVVTKIDDSEFEHICLELGLEDTIIPSRTIARHLADLCEGRNTLEISTMARDEARTFSFVVRAGQGAPLADLALPDQTRVVCVYRNHKLILPEAGTRLREKDEVVLIVHRDRLDELEAHFGARALTKQA